MTNDRWAGSMLIAGSAGVLITLALHPSGRELFSADTFEAAARKLMAVHSLALACLPLWLAGAVGISRHIDLQADGEQHLGTTGLVFYGFGLIAMMTGVVFDGLVSPGLAGQINATTGTVGQGWRIAFNYNSMLDLAFMHVFLAGSSLGVALWSAAMLRGGSLPRLMGGFGILLAIATLTALLTGQVDRYMHLYLLAFLGQAIWFSILGVLLCRVKRV